MNIKRNFAQSMPKSPAKRQMEFISNPNQVFKTSNLANDIQRAAHLLQKTIAKINGAYAPSTIRAYRANFERFIYFCQDVSAPALPSDSETVAEYIQNLTKSGLKSASIRLAVASISTIHKLNEFPDPTRLPDAKLELRRMHRALGRASKQAFGITEPILKKMLIATTSNLQGLRDRALILTAYDSLCRRSELTSLRLKDIQYDEYNSPIKIKIRKSKTDQEGIGRLISLDSPTQKAIKTWINQAKIKKGFLFRGIRNNGEILECLGAGQINRIYKKIATKAHLPKEQIKTISGHSFRVGKTQDLVRNGSSAAEIMHKGRWSKIDTLMRYCEQLEY